MCGTFGQKKLPLKKVKQEFLPETDIAPKEGMQLNLNTWVGKFAGILTPDKPASYQWAMFGLCPVWNDKKMYLFNARVEGKENPTNDPSYSGTRGIFTMPSFRNAVKSRRCIIPMDYFIEGPEKEKYNKPFLIHRKDSEPFFAAGIYEDWTDKSTRETIRTFSILTTGATPLLQEVGHHRSPLLLDPETIPVWLDPKADLDFIAELMKPSDTSEFEFYPVDSKIVKSKENNSNIEKPFTGSTI